MPRLLPIALIVVGTVFLIDKLGFFSISTIRSFVSHWWPALLIGLGLWMLFDKRGGGKG